MEINPNELSRNLVKQRWWQNITLTIYFSHTLTSWGDRMWGFAVGLFLVVLFPESLQNAAIFGFATCISVIIGAPFIGKWVDKTSRLKAARCALVVQNLAVIFCAILLIFFINFSSSWNGGLDIVFLVFIITFAVTGELASVASKIALEKDWIVVLARGNETKLSKMNATMRTIDLTTSILAPAVVAQIISFGSQTAGATFIASWNMVSGVVEIYLLRRIYKCIPELAEKMSGEPTDNSNGSQVPQIIGESSPTIEASHQHQGMRSPGLTKGLPAKDFAEVCLETPSPAPRLSTSSLFKSHDSYHLGLASSEQHLTTDGHSQRKWQWHDKITDLLMGWKQYFQHPVRFAGVGLAFLYMTVLGFDSITIGYMYSQGVSESTIGILTAAGAVFGIFGSLSFPSLRRFGKCFVGIFGFGFEAFCLVLCVVSIFMSGSPFVPESLWQNSEAEESASESSNSNSTVFNNDDNSNSSENSSDRSNITSYDSVIVFIVGILLSRYGLWIADLSVTQFFQEEVTESQRGILNGVQHALNQFLSLIKFVLVIVFPTSDTFGYLIALSWIFVFMGWTSFVIFAYSWKKRQNKIECTR